MKFGWRLAALLNGIQDATAYRVEFLFEILGSAFVPAAIQWVFWYALFKVGGATRIAGMSYHEMIQYTLMTLLFSQIRGGDLDFELAEMIRSGQLSNYLLRPVSVIEFTYLRGLGPKLLIASIGLMLGLALETAHPISHGISPLRMFGAMGLALLGNVIHFQLGAALASVAFLWEEAYSMLMVKNMLVSLLSGELIPLTLFPERFHWIWQSTPFYLYVFGPIQYASGRWSHAEFALHVGYAGLWMLGGYLAIRVAWGWGIRRYQSLGG